MKQEIIGAVYSLWKLFRFLFWYLLALAALFWLLPVAMNFVLEQYEAMSGGLKIAIVAGFFSLIAAWQFYGRRDRSER